MSRRKLLLANNPLFAGPALEERERGIIPYREINVESIDADPNQPRVTFDDVKLAELAESIRAYGVLNPILVRKSPIAGRYIVVAGERRLRASRQAGLTSIPAIIDQGDDKSQERTLALQLVENLQRDDLAPLERAQAVGMLRDSYSLSLRDIAERLGMSKSSVQRTLELLDLPDDLLHALKEGAAESKILLLKEVPEPELRAELLKDLTATSRAKLVSNIKGRRFGAGEKKQASPEDLRIADELQRSLGVKVQVNRSEANSNFGKITIEFYSEDDLRGIFRLLMAEAEGSLL